MTTQDNGAWRALIRSLKVEALMYVRRDAMAVGESVDAIEAELTALGVTRIVDTPEGSRWYTACGDETVRA